MIFPKPKSEQYFEGKYTLKAYDDNTELMYLYDKYRSGNTDLTITLNPTFTDDEYNISISKDGITIVASDNCGVFRAISSLRQLIKTYGKELPYCAIKDDPDFKKRSYMLDISRCRMPKLEQITKLVDLLAELKYNEFQLYMESFVFKYETLPEYTKDFDCLNADDIKYLDKYCSDRFIDLVPNQASFGHLRDWLDLEAFKHLRVGDEDTNTATINPLLDESFEFVDKLYSALLPNFTSEYVNIGLDEAFGLGKYQLEEICNEKGKDNVFMDWLCKLSDHIEKKYNKKVQFWSDMIYDYPEAYSRVPEGAIALNWGYDLIKNAMMEKRCMDLNAKNTPYYICPGNCTWISLTGRFDVMNFNVRTCGELGRKYGALGYMLTDWGCGEGHTHFPVWSVVPCSLGAQYAWNVGEEQNGERIKFDYVRAAQKYADENVFGAKISWHLERLQQYYLLEPERVHCMTMCGYTLRLPLSETKAAHFFDLEVCGDNFYFDNVIYYVKKILCELDKIDFDQKWRRQIYINANMVILSAELCKIRIDKRADAEKIDELTTMIDDIYDEYTSLWDIDNYPKGKEHLLNQLADRKNELLAMK